MKKFSFGLQSGLLKIGFSNSPFKFQNILHNFHVF